MTQEIVNQGVDLTGKKIGLLTVESAIRINGKWFWKCQCECGLRKNVVTGNLTRDGGTRSCGARHHWPKRPNMVELRLYGNYVRSAKNTRRTFSITFAHFCELVNGDCSYCGAKPSLGRATSTKRLTKPHNGIDRTNNSVGYEPGNVVSCCERCNRMKFNLDPNEFRAHAAAIAAYSK